ncbi:hypothetical protein, conserved [Leishmania tarentolae]|uniref:Enriched in surface-labeled proteome protein 9 n=1 Tax=Leishmania tarentolae TaxID=5689 RepID=A0A640KU58_LEITA|nr:hypothetical protein, conserved [Leishmania tarentolae]
MTRRQQSTQLLTRVADATLPYLDSTSSGWHFSLPFRFPSPLSDLSDAIVWRVTRTSFSVVMTTFIATATLLALFSASVAVSAASLLPLYGEGLFDVEVVCRSAAPSEPTVYGKSVISAFRFAMKTGAGGTDGNVQLPLYVERIQDCDYVRTYYINSTDKYSISDSKGCAHVKGSYESSDEVLLAGSLSTMLRSPLSATPSPGITRGMNVDNYSAQFILTIPSRYGGTGVSATYNAAVLTTTQQWSVNLMQVDLTPVSIEVTTADRDSEINNCLFTFSFFGWNVSDMLESLPFSCENVLSTSSPAWRPAKATLPRIRAPSGASKIFTSLTGAFTDSSRARPLISATDTANYTMPEFPDGFTANFLVISPLKKSLYQIRAAYVDAYFFRASLKLPMKGIAGRAYEYEWLTHSWNQISNYHTMAAVPKGQEITDEALRKYFFPGLNICKCVVIAYDAMAGSTRSLLLYWSSQPPTFIGNQTVRNIPCGVWVSETQGVRVTWYWTTSDLVNTSAFQVAHDLRSDEPGYARLVRMTVTGRGGAPPLFTHHPFFPQGDAFPVADRNLACNTMMPPEADMDCNSYPKNTDVTHIYEITSFVPYVRVSDFSRPAACRGAKVSGSIPSFQCNHHGIKGGAVSMLLFMVALLFSLAGGCCVWCPFSQIVRLQQDELVRCMSEVHLAQSVNGAEGQGATAVVTKGEPNGRSTSP